jgi:hypothetical protein
MFVACLYHAYIMPISFLYHAYILMLKVYILLHAYILLLIVLIFVIFNLIIMVIVMVIARKIVNLFPGATIIFCCNQNKKFLHFNEMGECKNENKTDKGKMEGYNDR